VSAARTDGGPQLKARGQTPTYLDSTPHDAYMRQLATRIAWLQRRRHWWIRSIRDGRWS
jgi:hypothetical protein